MKKNFLLISTAFICLIFIFSVSNLYSQINKQQHTPTIDKTKLTAKFKTDLRIDVVHSSRCACALPGVDAFYMANIMVDVSNHKTSGVGAATESILTVTFWDLMQNKSVTITKNLPKLHPYSTNPWTLQRYVVVNSPVLVKKSVGIKAVIKPKTLLVFDPVPANNIKIVKKCQIMVY